MATKKAAAKSPGTGLQKWSARFLEDAAKAVAETGSGGGHKTISIRGGVMSIDKNKVPNSNMNLVVIDSVMVRQWYGDQVFDADNPQSPLCWAIGRDEKTLAPPDASELTDKQADLCADCKWSKYNTANTGKGQACKDTRRLMVMAEDSLDDVNGAELRVLSTPPTSSGTWDTFVKKVAADSQRPPYAMVTNAHSEFDDKVQVKLTFSAVGNVEDSKHVKDIDGTFDELMAKRKFVAEDIMYGFPKQDPAALAAKAKPQKTAARTEGRNFTKAGAKAAKAPAKKMTRR